MSVVTESLRDVATNKNMWSVVLSSEQGKFNEAYSTMSPTVTFGSSAAETVANELGLEENDEGHLVNKETKEPAIPSDSDEPMTLDEFAGAGAGSRVFIKKDFNSVSAYVEEHRLNE